MAKGIYARYACVETQDGYKIIYDATIYNAVLLTKTGYGSPDFILYQSNGNLTTSSGAKTIDKWTTSDIFYADNVGSYNKYKIYRCKRTDTLQGNQYILAECTTMTSVVNIAYSKGTYLTDIIADYGSLPVDGRHTDGYWYVFVKMASDFKVNVGGIWRDAPTGYANVGGINRPQSEVKVNLNGIWR